MLTFGLCTTPFVFNDTPPRLQVDCNLYFIFYIFHIICEMFAMTTDRLKTGVHSTSETSCTPKLYEIGLYFRSRLHNYCLIFFAIQQTTTENALYNGVCEHTRNKQDTVFLEPCLNQYHHNTYTGSFNPH